MKEHKKAIYFVIFMVILIIILWKIVYKNGYKKSESSYLYLDGSYYINPQWQDSWPNH